MLSCCEVRLLFHIDLTSDIILKRMNKLFIKRAKKIVCKNISQSHSAQKFCVWEKLFLFQFYVEKMVKWNGKQFVLVNKKKSYKKFIPAWLNWPSKWKISWKFSIFFKAIKHKNLFYFKIQKITMKKKI